MEAFRDVIRTAGLTPPEHIEAGRLHRFPGVGKCNGNTAGWCRLFPDLQGGIFGDWSADLTESWQAKQEKPLTPEERLAFAKQIAESKATAEAEQAREQAAAAKRALKIWQASKPASASHPYLLAKKVKHHGLRMAIDGRLVIPMRHQGILHSLQFIDGKGVKRFLAGGRVAGCYHSIGKPDSVICLAEGFATGATIHEATGNAVAVAFNAGNLVAVARIMREKFPAICIIVCADDDHRAEGNPGLAKAREAAIAVGGLLAVPDFGPDRPAHITDFNDLAILHGLSTVKTCIEAATFAVRPEADISDEAAVTDVQGKTGAASAVTSGRANGVTENILTISIPEAERPGFRVVDDWTEARESVGKLRPGVWFFGSKASRKSEEPASLIQQWICSPLYIEAVTFDGQENNFGRLLRFRNTLGRWREWAMPMELLSGAGEELRGTLLAMGMEIDPLAKVLLTQYLQLLLTAHMEPLQDRLNGATLRSP